MDDEFWLEDSYQDWQMAKYYNCPEEYLDILENEYYRRFKQLSIKEIEHDNNCCS